MPGAASFDSPFSSGAFAALSALPALPALSALPAFFPLLPPALESEVAAVGTKTWTYGMISRPSMYGRKTSGTTTPSPVW